MKSLAKENNLFLSKKRFLEGFMHKLNGCLLYSVKQFLQEFFHRFWSEIVPIVIIDSPLKENRKLNQSMKMVPFINLG